MLVVSKTGTNLASKKVSAAAIAQLVEHLICNQRVGSSSLSGGTTFPQHIQYDEYLSLELIVWGYAGDTLFFDIPVFRRGGNDSLVSIAMFYVP